MFFGLISFVFGISMWNSKYVYNDCKSRWRTTPTENKTFLTSPSWKVLICGRTLYLSPSKKGPYFVSDPTNAIMIIQGTLYQRLFRFLVSYRWHFGLCSKMVHTYVGNQYSKSSKRTTCLCKEYLNLFTFHRLVQSVIYLAMMKKIV